MFDILEKDSIFVVIKNHRLPISRDGLSIKDFLKIYFDEYIVSLRYALSSKSENFLRIETYEKLKTKLPIIEKLCKNILEIFTLYDNANLQILYKKLDELMKSLELYLYVSEINMSDEGIHPYYYRIRAENNDRFDRKDLFHIPIDKRHLIKPYRYSIAGYPCLYMASSIELCWFECGMPKVFSVSQFETQKVDKIKID